MVHTFSVLHHEKNRNTAWFGNCPHRIEQSVPEKKTDGRGKEIGQLVEGEFGHGGAVSLPVGQLSAY